MSDYLNKLRTDRTITIDVDETESQPFDLGELTLLGIFLPDDLTATAITFRASPSVDGTYVDVFDDEGNPISVTVGAGTYVALDPSIFAGIPFIQLVGDSPQSTTPAVIIVAIGRVV